MRVVDGLDVVYTVVLIRGQHLGEHGADLDEGLHATPTLNLLLAHPLVHFQRVSFDAGHDCVRVWSVFRAFVHLSDHHNFPARLSTAEDDGNLARLVNFDHKPNQYAVPNDI